MKWYSIKSSTVVNQRNKFSRKSKEQSKKDNPEKLATQGTHDEEKQNTTQHNMCWTPQYANKHK